MIKKKKKKKSNVNLCSRESSRWSLNTDFFFFFFKKQNTPLNQPTNTDQLVYVEVPVVVFRLFQVPGKLNSITRPLRLFQSSPSQPSTTSFC